MYILGYNVLTIERYRGWRNCLLYTS
ncbi:hypothetical protein A5836_002168, partial [Enterococcus faecium]